MNSVQLEQLISGYLDDELSPNRKQEVASLLQADPAAKKLYEEFVNIRNEIRHTRRYNLPHDFQQKLFERLDAETIFVSGKPVEKTTSVDFTIPVQAERRPAWQSDQQTINRNGFRAKFLHRLKNLRVLASVSIVLLIGVSVFLINPFSGDNRETALIVPDDPAVVAPEDSPKDVPPPALPEGGSVSETTGNHELAIKDGKPVVEIACQLSPTARDDEYFPKMLADRGYSYVVRENGNKAVTVYEFELPVDQLLPFISSLMHSNRDEIVDYKLPDAFLSLLHRPGENRTVDTIIVRLNVSKND